MPLWRELEGSYLGEVIVKMLLAQGSVKTYGDSTRRLVNITTKLWVYGLRDQCVTYNSPAKLGERRAYNFGA